MIEQNKKKEKALTRYTGGILELKDALAGLEENQLDFSRQEGKWSIREITHHIVDAENIWQICIKAALGNPGCTFDLEWYIPDNKAAVPLDYSHRPIDSALGLFQAIRTHIVELIHHLPNSWEQAFTITRKDLPEGKKFNIGEVIGFQNLHLSRHIKQIIETRKKYKI